MRRLSIVLLLIATGAVAQTRGDVGGQVSGSSHALGYVGPAYGAVGHVVARRNRFGFESLAGWSVAHKAQTSDGNRFDASGSGRYYFGQMFASGGFVIAHQSTSLYSKTGAGPSVGAGYDDGINTLQGSVDWLLDENRSVGFTVAYERVIRFSDHGYISARPFVTGSRFDSPHIAGVTRQGGVRAGIAIGIGRRK